MKNFAVVLLFGSLSISVTAMKGEIFHAETAV